MDMINQQREVLLLGGDMSQPSKCWCGNTLLAPFAPAYLQCQECGTLVLAHMPDPGELRVTDDQHDLYGRAYYDSHLVKDYGYPELSTRTREDIPERCLYWLRTVLKYKSPPGRVLELGSAHGGFVALLCWAGFDATGLEMSPWVVNFAHQTFEVPVLLGPIEEQQIPPGTLDAIALMDVLEHLHNPLSTMEHCLRLLKPDGLLVIQTPRLPEEQSYEEMVSQRHRFLEQLKENEHLYLFSQRSIREFFHRLEANHLVFEPAIFAHYDMFLVVSRAPLILHSSDEIVQALSTKPHGRMIQALLDADDQHRALQQRYATSEAEQSMLLQHLAAAEADRAARLTVIEQQGDELAQLQAQVHHWLQESQSLTARVQELAAERDRLVTEQATLRQQFESVQHVVETIAHTRVYRLLRLLGRWKFME
jgi:SAM-dependent methyltransferase